MYEFIEGKLVEKHPTHVVVENQGLGYHLFVSLNTSARLKEEGCKLFTHLVVREDAHLLYGFFEAEERTVFRHLIEVSGIGPNTAIVILSGMSPSEVRDSILNGDVKAFERVKGVGPKTAQRVIVDLQDKMAKTEAFSGESSSAHNTDRNEALSALTALGFEEQKARKALDKAQKGADGTPSVEELVKNALKHL